MEHDEDCRSCSGQCKYLSGIWPEFLVTFRTMQNGTVPDNVCTIPDKAGTIMDNNFFLWWSYFGQIFALCGTRTKILVIFRTSICIIWYIWTEFLVMFRTITWSYNGQYGGHARPGYLIWNFLCYPISSFFKFRPSEPWFLIKWCIELANRKNEKIFEDMPVPPSCNSATPRA